MSALRLVADRDIQSAQRFDTAHVAEVDSHITEQETSLLALERVLAMMPEGAEGKSRATRLIGRLHRQMQDGRDFLVRTGQATPDDGTDKPTQDS